MKLNRTLDEATNIAVAVKLVKMKLMAVAAVDFSTRISSSRSRTAARTPAAQAFRSGRKGRRAIRLVKSEPFPEKTRCANIGSEAPILARPPRQNQISSC